MASPTVLSSDTPNAPGGKLLAATLAFRASKDRPPAFDRQGIVESLSRGRQPSYVLRDRQNGRIGIAVAGEVSATATLSGRWELLAALPPLYPEWLGERSFAETHGVRFPYIAGAMANGIATTRLVIAMAQAEMLGFFGAAGLSVERVEKAVHELGESLGARGLSYGVNLIHSPNEPEQEQKLADLYLAEGVRRVSASAYMTLTRPLVQYALSGLRVDPDGRIQRTNHVFAKISRAEVAERFLAPAPQEMVSTLVREGRLTAREAELSARVPIAEDITVESDSGGHTDNQPLSALFPIIAALRDRLAAAHGYDRPLRVGAAGGLGSPASVAAAFSLGAAYVLTGSVNQAAVESGLSPAGRELLAHAELGDFIMAPAADMFELGVKVQVLKRGTLFASRAKRLYELLNTYPSLEELPDKERDRLESNIFGASCDDVWRETQGFWERRDPAQVERAGRDPRHKMALCFRWYLGLSSRWAIDGTADRQADFQIWCGPAMAAFNDWARGTFLENVEERTVVQIARNLLEGAAVVTRAQQLRSYGVPVPAEGFQFRPRVFS